MLVVPCVDRGRRHVARWSPSPAAAAGGRRACCPPVDGAGRRPVPRAAVRVVPGQPGPRLRAPRRARPCGRRRPARSRSAASSPGPATWSSSTPTGCGRRTAGWRRPRWRPGDVVAAGAGRRSQRPASCTSGSARGDTYVDPAPLLGRLVERPRLVPTDGTPPPPGAAAPPALRRLPLTGRRRPAPLAVPAPARAPVHSLDRPTARWAVRSRPPATTCGRSGAGGGSVNRRRSLPMAVITMRQMLEAGVHFGHQTRRWNPKMKRFIFGERNGIYIIDLEQTLTRVETAYAYVRDLVAGGGIDPVRRHEEAGPGPGPQLRREVRHAVRQRALAGRHAHQLRHDLQARRQDARVRAHARLRRVRGDAEEGSAAAHPRDGEAAAQPRRPPRPDQARPTRSSCSTRRRSTSPSPRPTSSASRSSPSSTPTSTPSSCSTRSRATTTPSAPTRCWPA